jgi:hypothetical protein
MPVKGKSRTTPAMMKKAWKPMMMVSPVAIRREKSERAVWAMRRPEPTIKMKANHDGGADHAHLEPMAAKIMSDVSSGTAGSEWGGPRPVPPRPPVPRPNQPSLSCTPVHVEVGGCLPRVEPLAHPQMDLAEVAGGHVGPDREEDEARAPGSRSGRW